MFMSRHQLKWPHFFRWSHNTCYKRTSQLWNTAIQFAEIMKLIFYKTLIKIRLDTFGWGRRVCWLAIRQVLHTVQPFKNSQIPHHRLCKHHLVSEASHWWDSFAQVMLFNIFSIHFISQIHTETNHALRALWQFLRNPQKKKDLLQWVAVAD